MNKPPLFKLRSYVYDYILSDGRNAHKGFQIAVMHGQTYSANEVTKELIRCVPNVLPISICEILVDDISLQDLQDNVKRGVYMPYKPIFINTEKLHTKQ